MASKFDLDLEKHFAQEDWKAARTLLEREVRKSPESHWLITQLGVTLYEEKRYAESLEYFLRSLQIKNDCPLTLWNIAGVLDALGDHALATQIFSTLIKSKVSPKDDPCWESTAWSQSLKADCVYRLGVCFEKMKQTTKAENCYRQYVMLRSLGIDSIYSTDQAITCIRSLSTNGVRGKNRPEIAKTFDSTLKTAGANRGKSKVDKAMISSIQASLSAAK